MTTDRDALWDLIDDRLPEMEIVRCDFAGAIADAILDAGWRPPAQVLKTVEEIDALPAGAVVLTMRGHGQAWVRIETGHWTNGPSCYSTKTLVRACGPRVTVLLPTIENATVTEEPTE